MKKVASILVLVLMLQALLLCFTGCGGLGLDKLFKKELSTVELAELGQKCAVTIEVSTVWGGSSKGSGFFIDGQGTVITAYHVIEGAESIEVVAGSGAKFPLEKVISFNPVYDIAVLKIDYESTDYLKICEDEIVVGEPVVAIGSAQGTLVGTCTYGYISSLNRKVGLIECLQTDAAISSGNSGGPLLNIYGEVIGMNCFTYVNGQNLNLAVKMSMFDKIGEEKNYDMSEMKRWYNTERSRSYSPYDQNGDFHYSLVNNYDTVTGIQCEQSIDASGLPHTGYTDMMNSYMYAYDQNSYDNYISYLKDQGFIYHDTETSGTVYVEIYTNELKGYVITLAYQQSTLKLLVSMSVLA